MTREYTLTLASPEDEALARAAPGTDGQDSALKGLDRTPLARSELVDRRGRWPRGYDHIHLTRWVGTSLVQWTGRRSDGFHYPIGRLMRLVEIAPAPPVPVTDEPQSEPRP